MVTLVDLPWEDVIHRYILPRLSYNDCYSLYLTDAILKEIISLYFQSLRKISTEFVCNNNNVGLNVLELMSRKSGNVVNLNLALEFGNIKWQTELIRNFIRNNKNLVEVNFVSREMASVTDTAMHGLIHCKKLKRLYVCEGSLSPECIATLYHHLPGLRIEFVKRSFIKLLRAPLCAEDLFR